MNFTQAVQAVRDGNFVARLAWDRLNQYCVLLPNIKNIWLVKYGTITDVPYEPNARNWVPTVVDFIAEDWKIIERV